jgi:hypothetical protein
MPANVDFYTTGYSDTFDSIPHQNRRYIGMCDRSAKVFWLDNRVWYVDRSRNSIECVDLSTSRTSYSIPLGFTIYEFDGHKKGFIAAVYKYSTICIWNVQGKAPQVVFRKDLPDSLTIFKVFDDSFVCLTGDNAILVWDIHSGELRGQIRLSSSLVHRAYSLVLKKFGDFYFILETSSGNFIWCMERQSLPDATLPREYTMCGAIYPCEDVENGIIEEFEVLPHCLITSGAGQIRIRRLPSQENPRPKVHFDAYDGVWEPADPDTFPEETPSPSTVLSRNYSAMHFGFRSNVFGEFYAPAADLDWSSIYVYNWESGDTCLCVWDFRVFRKYDRYFELVKFGEHLCYLIYEDVTDTPAEGI